MGKACRHYFQLNLLLPIFGLSEFYLPQPDPGTPACHRSTEVQEEYPYMVMLPRYRGGGWVQL